MRYFFARLVFLPTYAWNLLLGRILRQRHWWDPIEPRIILGARPLRRDVQTLVEQGVGGVVNMCQEYQGPIDLYDHYNIEQLWLPTIDFQSPSLEFVIQGVEFIQRKVESGKGVYIHCKAGRARSATVALCWMVKYRGMTAEQAQAKLLDCRPHVNPKIYMREVVVDFVKQLPTPLGSPQAKST